MHHSRIHGLCDKCIEDINWDLDNNFKYVINEFSFDHVLSCCIYNEKVRAIIYSMKLHGKPYIARNIANLLYDRIKIEEDLNIDYIVPVPCTKNKKLRRGFNQAELISKYLSNKSHIPNLNALEKIKETTQSKNARGQDRYFVQQGAFSLAPNINVQGKRILLVDDVITTGSTADECSRILKEEGASFVCVLCLASAAIVS